MLMTDAPFLTRYEGDGQFSAPSGHWARECDKQFVVGGVYRMIEHHERSTATHSHYFAEISNAWATLPDDQLTEYPTAEHLRKKLLVKAGYADERSIVCASKAEAQRVAAFVKPMDEYAVVLVREAVVRVYTAQSQSYRAMGKKTFQESKEAVLRAIDELLGVEPRERAA
jgi:hypothetical protein